MAVGVLRARLVPHVRQSFSWDCGLACAEMVLRALGVPPADCSLPSLQKHLPASSIWTIDLAHLLHRFGVRFRFLTLTIGVDPSYKDQPFYQHTLDDDSKRVNDLFARPDLAVERRSMTRGEFAALMRPQEHMVMALVDRRFLYRHHSSVTGYVEGFLSQCFNGYIGHYVLISGYDAPRDGYYLYDPAKTDEPLFVHAADLHAARCCHGTDQDLLLIPWRNSFEKPTQAQQEAGEPPRGLPPEQPPPPPQPAAGGDAVDGAAASPAA